MAGCLRKKSLPSTESGSDTLDYKPPSVLSAQISTKMESCWFTSLANTTTTRTASLNGSKMAAGPVPCAERSEMSPTS